MVDIDWTDDPPEHLRFQCRECTARMSPEPLVVGGDLGIRVAWVCSVHGAQVIEDPSRMI